MASMDPVSKTLSVPKNVGAVQIVFEDKTDILQTEKSSDSSDSSKGGSTGDTPITPKDFYWDQILFYLVSAILGLSFLDISVEFFRGSIIQCYIANTAATHDQQVAYFNNYCYGSLPNSQYYLIFILISALIIIAPHYLWTSYFGAYFDFFFDLAKKLHRLRDTNTGEYSPYNFELVKKLEQNFSSSNPWMFRWYKLKLLAQLGVCIIVQAVNVFYFDAEDFDESFPCPTDTSLLNTTVWPLPDQLTCVYNSLTLLYFLRNTALGLVTAAIVVCIIGLVWCYASHTTELGAKDIAAFCDASCLPPEEYPFPSTRKVLRRIFCCGKERLLKSIIYNNKRAVSIDERKIKTRSVDDGEIITGHDLDHNEIWDDVDDEIIHEVYDREYRQEKLSCFFCFKAITPRIHTDLDFLITRLFYADSGHGQVFKDIQTQKELDKWTDLKFLYLDLRSKEILKKWSKLHKLSFQPQFEVPPFRIMLTDFIQKFTPGYNLLMDISFGNRVGHSLILGGIFHTSVTVHFNKYYINQEEICHEDKYETESHTIHMITYQANIFSQTKNSIKKSVKLFEDVLKENDGRKVDVILIGPLKEQSESVKANRLIKKVYHHLSDKAILLAICPLMIGGTLCTNHFIHYQPSRKKFESIEGEVNEYLVNSFSEVLVDSTGIKAILNDKEDTYDSEYAYGLVVQCNDIQCIYEFNFFRKKTDKGVDVNGEGVGDVHEVTVLQESA